MAKLSVSLEDYIEEIYIQILKNGNAKVTEIANKLKVKKIHKLIFVYLFFVM